MRAIVGRCGWALTPFSKFQLFLLECGKATRWRGYNENRQMQVGTDAIKYKKDKEKRKIYFIYKSDFSFALFESRHRLANTQQHSNFLCMWNSPSVGNPKVENPFQHIAIEQVKMRGGNCKIQQNRMNFLPTKRSVSFLFRKVLCKKPLKSGIAFKQLSQTRFLSVIGYGEISFPPSKQQHVFRLPGNA